jgi:glutamine amidotransferase
MTHPVIIDTGFANIVSIKKAIEFIGYQPIVTSNPLEISRGKYLILPGVGAFDNVMKHLKEKRIDKGIHEALIRDGTRILGICLGLQLLAESSEEGTFEPGLGLISGECKKILSYGGIKIPHVGFNSIVRSRNSQLLRGIPEDFNFYFLHSFALSPENTSCTVASVDYGQMYTAVIEKDSRIFGTQFHPEKSQKTGLKILANFLGT